MKVILFFIDGVGLGDQADDNPWFTLPLPHLTKLLGGQKLHRGLQAFSKPGVRFYPTDATLGIPGLPQSATGQATIWSGRNAPQWMGEHKSGFPGPKLKKWLEDDHIYTQAMRLGKSATFANAYTDEFYKKRTTQRGWVSVSTATMLSAGLRLRNLRDLQEGKAVYFDLTHTYLKERYPEIPTISPEQAADHLLSLSEGHDLTVYEYFLTDTFGHRQDMRTLGSLLEQVDRFLGRLASKLPPSTMLILTSDHGNSEDLTVKTHTTNLVPTLLVGEGAECWEGRVESLVDIAPTIMHFLQTE